MKIFNYKLQITNYKFQISNLKSVVFFAHRAPHSVFRKTSRVGNPLFSFLLNLKSQISNFKFQIFSALPSPRSALFLLLALVPAACKLGPDYQRPELPVSAAYKSATSVEKAQPRLGRDWWRLFKDPDLDALMTEALQSNQDLIAAMERVAEARAAATAVESQFYPVVTLNPSATRSRFPTLARSNTSVAGTTPRSTTGGTPTPTPTPGPGGNPQTTGSNVSASPTPKVTRTNFYQIPFDLNYEIDIWGRVRRAVEAARAQGAGLAR